MSLSELETLRSLRRHRADRAERALREAKRHERTLQAHIEQAQEALEQTRQQEARQSAQLLNDHQGHVVSVHMLKSWTAKEHTLSADTRREEGRLQALHGQKDAHVVEIENAQKQASQCLRQVEKLQELSTLLAQEVT
ncbi:YscO family type III secretion system apparatus protein [Pseudomonas fildesensis]|uniref:Type III secretion protein n=1 Tax=Pseudomonas fildesensis TaxID=1674920 RepID=A0A0J8FYR8_9PSED|nr:YscO family type III secretion system apparatus protein [Pseudomonas fildesensis]KMT55290.1 type III secretion protein [Pseudomonas fildesensis]